VVRSRIVLGFASAALSAICIFGAVATPANARNNDSCFVPSEGGAAMGDDGEENPPCDAPVDRPRYRGTPPTVLFFPSVIPPTVTRVAEFFNFAPQAYLGGGSQERGVPNPGHVVASTGLSLLDHMIGYDLTDPNHRVVSLTDSPTGAASVAQQMSIAMGGIHVYIYVVHADPNFFNVGQSLNWIRVFHPDSHHRARAALAIERLTLIGLSMWVAVGPLSSDQVREAHVATPNINPATDFRQQGLRVMRNGHYLKGDYRYMRASGQLLTE
jgi:hypothetical protein